MLTETSSRLLLILGTPTANNRDMERLGEVLDLFSGSYQQQTQVAKTARN